MDSPIAVIPLILFAVSGIVLLVFLSFRAILWAKRRPAGAEFVGSLGLGSVLNPAEEVAEERRRVKRSDDGSGDPDEPEA